MAITTTKLNANDYVFSTGVTQWYYDLKLDNDFETYTIKTIKPSFQKWPRETNLRYINRPENSLREDKVKV